MLGLLAFAGVTVMGAGTRLPFQVETGPFCYVETDVAHADITERQALRAFKHRWSTRMRQVSKDLDLPLDALFPLGWDGLVQIGVHADCRTAMSILRYLFSQTVFDEAGAVAVGFRGDLTEIVCDPEPMSCAKRAFNQQGVLLRESVWKPATVREQCQDVPFWRYGCNALRLYFLDLIWPVKP